MHFDSRIDHGRSESKWYFREISDHLSQVMILFWPAIVKMHCGASVCSDLINVEGETYDIIPSVMGSSPTDTPPPCLKCHWHSWNYPLLPNELCRQSYRISTTWPGLNRHNFSPEHHAAMIFSGNFHNWIKMDIIYNMRRYIQLYAKEFLGYGKKWKYTSQLVLSAF